MDDDGYTLVDALTALAIISLAVGGVVGSVQMLNGAEASTRRVVAATDDLLAARRVVTALPADIGPFESPAGTQRFQGSSTQAVFDCEGSAPCALTALASPSGPTLSATVDARREVARLPTVRHLRLEYTSARDGTSWTSWPDGRPGDRLAAVSVIADEHLAAVLTFSREQSGACLFDASVGRCLPPAGAPRGQP